MTGKEFVKRLKNEDWELERINGSHHMMRKDGVTVAVPVHAGKDLPKGTLNQLLKDTGLKGR